MVVTTIYLRIPFIFGGRSPSIIAFPFDCLFFSLLQIYLCFEKTQQKNTTKTNKQSEKHKCFILSSSLLSFMTMRNSAWKNACIVISYKRRRVHIPYNYFQFCHSYYKKLFLEPFFPFNFLSS